MLRTSVAFILIACAGCGGGRPRADVDRGKDALVAALENWKKNEPAAKLSGVQFAEDLRKTHDLTDYAVGPANATDPKFLLFPVTLKLKDKKGKATDREVTYSVELATPVRVMHDPYY
jgi:hypothetical protein